MNSRNEDASSPVSLLNVLTTRFSKVCRALLFFLRELKGKTTAGPVRRTVKKSRGPGRRGGAHMYSPFLETGGKP